MSRAKHAAIDRFAVLSRQGISFRSQHQPAPRGRSPEAPEIGGDVFEIRAAGGGRPRIFLEVPVARGGGRVEVAEVRA